MGWSFFFYLRRCQIDSAYNWGLWFGITPMVTEATVTVSRKAASAFHKALKNRFLNPSWEKWCPHSLSGHLPTGQTDFPIEIIKAEPTSLPPGKPCLRRFNQKLEKSHKFYSASYTSPFTKLNHFIILYLGQLFTGYLFQKWDMKASQEGEDLVSLPVLSN